MTADQLRYFALERRRNRRSIRIICAIGVATLALYVVSAPFFLSRAESSILLPAAVAMILVTGSYFVALGSRYYLRLPWLDVPFFLAAFAAQIVMNFAYFGIAAELGFTPSLLIAFHASVLMFAAAVAVVAAPRAFVALAAIMLAVAAAAIGNFATSPRMFAAQLLPVVTTFVVSLFANHTIDRSRRRAHELRMALEQGKAKSDGLLQNMLPVDIARRLKEGETIADSFSEVSVIFIDIVGFSTLARRISPKHLVDILNGFFRIVDECADRAGIEKVKTIGDAYLGVSGATRPVKNCAACALDFSMAVIDRIGTIEDEPIEVRIGIHTGAVIGGVIGTSRQAYDYWGDTMNVASRIQGFARPNSVFVSEATYARARHHYAFAPAELALLKGVGEAKVYQAFPLKAGGEAEQGRTGFAAVSAASPT
ncbi:MAG: hypothetical protein JWO25_1223 [Alphaproteobacteria bacterium]|nr:hypothetical protein [Alphaproteobacteria bacterium]